MRDVLDTLAKLPPRCAAVVEGQAVFINRGVSRLSPAFLGRSTVDQWNARHGVTPEQAKAMLVGVTLGWDFDGADPDTYAPSEHIGPFTYEFLATFVVPITLKAQTLGHGEMQAKAIALRLLTGLPEGSDCEFPLDLLETDDPR